MSIHLRKAWPEDLPVLQHWDRQQHVINAAPFDEWDWKTELSREPEWRELLIAEEAGRPLGFIQIIDPKEEETHYWGDVEPDLRAIDIWIGEKEDLGKGKGSAMMRLALERCFANERVKAVLIDPLTSNVDAHQFYARLGFLFIEEKKFGGDDCLVYQLKRRDWERSKKSLR